MSYTSYKEHINPASLFYPFLRKELASAAAAAADIQLGDAGVVVADLVVVVLPRVEVEVLVLGTLAEGRADKHVVEGLGVLVEEVSVALLNRHVNDVIHVDEARDLLKDLDGVDLDELVEVTSDDDTGGRVLLEDLGNEILKSCVSGQVLTRSSDETAATYSSDGSLLGSLFDTLVDGGTGVTVDGGGATLAGLVDVDGEEGLAGALGGLPGGSDGLAASVPGTAAGLNTTRVELERGALENLVLVVGGAQVGVPELNDIRTVDVGVADVTTGGATILVVLGNDLGVVVHNTAQRLDAASQSSEGDGANDGAIVGLARVVLDLLEEDEVRGKHLLDDLGGNALHVGGLGVEVAGVVVGNGDTTARLLGLEGDSRVVGGRVPEGRDGGQRQDTVEAESVVDETSDVAKVVAHLGVARVLATVGRGADDDGLGVGICSSCAYQ